MNGSLTAAGGASVLTPIIPYRKIVSGQPPQNHAGVRQVHRVLGKRFVDANRDPDGSTTTLDADLREIFIPEATADAVNVMRTPWDWCLMRETQDGTGTYELVVKYRNIQNVLAVFLRILPSNLWYFFHTIRKTDGSEFDNSGLIEPPPTKPETFPPDVIAAALTTQNTPEYSGIEDADLLVDPYSRTLSIPPRVLYAGVSTPLWNYTFHIGVQNVEVHYTFGFKPTKYEDGTPLQFNPVSGVVYDPSPGGVAPDGTELPPSGIDWSSGMPPGLSITVAQLAAIRLLRRGWRADSGGFSSITVDGGSESYGNAPFGGDLDKQEQAILSKLGRPPYGLGMIV